MRNIWFTADEHINHTNVIGHSKRPFDGPEDMKEALIKAHNEVVRNGDEVYHLGDLSWDTEGYVNYVTRLKGSHFLIKGNHDSTKNLKKLVQYRPHLFQWIKDVHRLKHDGKLYWLSHYPHLVWPNMQYGGMHLHGHSHGNLKVPNGKMVDVGVDMSPTYSPFSIDTVTDYVSMMPSVAHDHHKD